MKHNLTEYDKGDINDFNPDKYEDEKDENLCPSQIQYLLKYNSYYKIDELVADLLKYKKDEINFIKHNKEIPHYIFRSSIYHQLESLLCQIGEIEDKMKRKEHIDSLYKWYKNKFNFYFSLSRINKRTYLDKDEQKAYEDKLLEIKRIKEEEENNAKRYDEFEHRSIIQYKKIHNYIKDFKHKELLSEFQKNNPDNDGENKTIENNKTEGNIPNYFKVNKNSFKIEDFNFRELKKNYNIYMNKKDKFYSKKVDKKITEKNEVDSEIPKYEIKSSYSIERPPYNEAMVKIENNINAMKNKGIIEKNNESEIAKAIDDFGKKRALFQSDLNKKYELKNIIKDYKSNNKSSIKILPKDIKLKKIDKKTINDINNDKNNLIKTETNISNYNNQVISHDKNEQRKSETIDSTKEELKEEIKEEKKKEKENIVIENSNYEIKKPKRRLCKIYLNKVKNMGNNTENDENENNKNSLNDILNYNNKNNKDNFFLTSTYDAKKKDANNTSLEKNKTEEESSLIINREDSENKEKVLNVHFRFPKLKSSMALLSSKIDKPDTFMRQIALNPLFRAKNQNINLCSIDNRISLRRNRLNPLSNKRSISSNVLDYDYDINENNDMNINTDIDNSNLNNSNSIHEFTKKSVIDSKEHNFLNIKKGFDIFKKKEFDELEKVLKERNRWKTINKSAMYQAFIDPKISSFAPIQYLPLGKGSCLLKSLEPEKKSKKKSKKKK